MSELTQEQKVWVIEDGDYSDYRVVGVYSSKQNADMVQAKVGGTVAEWPLDPNISDMNAGHFVFGGEMLRDGTMERCDRVHDIAAYHINSQLTIWRRSAAPAYRGRDIQDCLTGTVWAKYVTHAIKIFNEERTRLIALNQWPQKEST